MATKVHPTAPPPSDPPPNKQDAGDSPTQPAPSKESAANSDTDQNDNRFNFKQSKCKDPIWMIIFYVHFFVMLLISFSYAKDFSKRYKNTRMSTSHYSRTLSALVVSAVVGILFSAAWLQIMRKVKLKTLLIVYFVGMLIMVLITLMSSLMMGGIAAFFLAMSLLWYCSIQNRIPYAEAIMRASTESFTDQPGPLVVVYVMAFCTFIWICIWGAATLGIFVSLGGSNYLVLFALLVSLFWTGETFKNVSHVTTAGAVAMWWFRPSSPNATIASLKRALTTSFGSICLGSFFVALVKALRTIVRIARDQAMRRGNIFQCCLLGCLDCILGCLEGMLRYFNMYAFTYVAVYGHSWMEAARMTNELFASKGLTALINDDLIGMVLIIGSLIGGVLAAIFSVLITGDVGVAVAGFCIGCWITLLAMNCVQSAVATTFVCLAEDPAALQAGQPNWYQTIKDATSKM